MVKGESPLIVIFLAYLVAQVLPLVYQVGVHLYLFLLDRLLMKLSIKVARRLHSPRLVRHFNIIIIESN